ncbi:MAG TPA: class I SAM-dependent methyltransferase [Bdellovibrionota bacterium]|jgi:SAM-dependent methyltransferase
MDAKEFYDRMAVDYHLIFSGGSPMTSERQGEIIDKLLRTALGGNGPFRVLDCSCGVGTQAFGLARLGHQVTGVDISSRAIMKAKSEAARLSLPVKFFEADMRSLEGIEGPFDAVLSFDNSVAHLTTEADLAFALSSVLSMLRPKGVFLCSLRDYDALKNERPTGTIPRHIKDSMGERVYVQTWDWSEDGRSYDLRLFVLKPTGANWEAQPLLTKMRAYSRGEIVTEAEKTGFESGEWLFANQTEYYQPIFMARKG